MKLAFLILLYLSGLAVVVQEIFDDLHIIQLKEYRIDRLRDFFFSRGGSTFFKKRIINILFFFVFLGVDTGITFLATARSIASEIEVIPLVLFLAYISMQVYYVSRRMYKKNVQYPKITLRMSTSIFGTFFVLLAIIFLKSELIFTYIESSTLFFLAMAPLFAAFGAALTFPLSFVLKKRMFFQSKEKRARYKNLIVIGITGSYGKTSVKEYLYPVLKTQLSVLKTEEHVNTEVGVARTILEKLTSDIDVFIVEMGAYRKGEIQAIANIVKPTMGVITAINEQHLSLFGSMNAIVNTKAELVFSLPKTGVAILNKDNSYVRKIAKKLKRKTYFYSMEDDADILLLDTRPGIKKTQFTVLVEGKKIPFTTKLVGAHNIQNLLPVIVIAMKLGISLKNIQKAIASLNNLPDNMEILEEGNDIIVNNTYNLNPASIDAFLDIAALHQDKKKILILDDLLELGNDAPKIHREIAKKLIGRVDVLILIGLNYPGIIRKALLGTQLKKVHVTRSSDKIAKIIDPIKGKIIGFLGRGAQKIITDLYE